MTTVAYLFGVCRIQPYLFAGGKLKDTVSASILLDYLCHEPLNRVIKACELDIDTDIEIPRRAGGVFYAVIHNQGKALALQHLWTLTVQQLVPGIEFVQSLSSADSGREALRQGLTRLRGAQNRCTLAVPPTSPLARRSPRTGMPAEVYDQTSSEWIDRAIHIKRQFRREKSEAQPLSGEHNYQTLEQKFTPQGVVAGEIRWPVDTESDFPFVGDDRRVAIVHADGNGLGEVLERIHHNTEGWPDKRFFRLYRAFCQCVEKVAMEAVREAAANVLLPHLSDKNFVPARPLVLGGDDLTIIVRADLALNFTQAFIEAFERYSAEELKALSEAHEVTLPERLTACAGIVYLGAKQPFYLGYGLAEDICRNAKRQSRQVLSSGSHDTRLIPSSIQFHRLTTSMIEDMDTLFKQELSPSHNGVSYHLSLGAYRVGSVDAALPSLNSLKSLIDRLKTLPGNGSRFRELATYIHHQPHRAKTLYRRWLDTIEKNEASKLGVYRKHLNTIASECGMSVCEDLPFFNASERLLVSPLMDMVVVLAIEGGGNA